MGQLPPAVQDGLGSLRRLETVRIGGLEWEVATFAGGRVRRRVNEQNLRFMQYNAALLSDAWRPELSLIPPRLGWKFEKNLEGSSRAAAVSRWVLSSARAELTLLVFQRSSA